MVSNKIRTEKGFTLIELLVVVIILGVIASISIVSVSGAFKNATVTACKTDWQTVKNAIQAYYNDNPSSNPASNDLYSSPAVVGSLAQLGYISIMQRNPDNRYEIVLNLPAGTVAVKIGNSVMPNNSSTDCSAL
jgi:prepilin-type N-terminal cleavage/methylation domain-containing protein